MGTSALNANYLSTDAKIELSIFLFSRGLYENSADAILDIEENRVELIEDEPDKVIIRIQGKKDWLI